MKSPSIEETMRKMCKAGEPVRAIEGGGKVEKSNRESAGRELWSSATKAKRQVRARLGECCESFQKKDFHAFSPEQLEDYMSKQVLLEKTAVASVLNKSLVDFMIPEITNRLSTVVVMNGHFELKYHHYYDNLNQHHH